MSFEDYMEEQRKLLEGDGEAPREEEKPDPVATLEKKIADLEARLSEQRPRRPDDDVDVKPIFQPQPRYEPPQDVKFTQEDLLDDPTGEKFNEKLNQYMLAKSRPIIENMLQLQARQAMQEALMRHPFLKDYSGEVDALLQNTNMAQLASPQTWNIVAMTIKERHFDEIRGKMSKQSPPDTHRSRSTPPSDGKRQLTPEQRYHARMLGLTDEQYLAGQESMNNG